VDILDVSVLRALVGKESATLTAFLSEYLTSTQSQSAQLRTAAQNGDTAAVGAIVHKLKSASRAIGAAALGDLCAELEDAARAGSAARVFELVPQFDAMYAQLEQQIARELDRSEACE
jgi:HPt (histidine-containing phosphotransfer) domain-containing protein